MLIKDIDLEIPLSLGQVFDLGNPPPEWPEPLRKSSWQVVKINRDELGNYRSYDLRACATGNRKQRRGK